MKFSYDYTADALYIKITDSLVDQTHQIDSGTMVDVDNFGRVVGIEVLQPARAWPLEDIKSQYNLTTNEKAILDSLWSQVTHTPYPFARPLMASS